MKKIIVILFLLSLSFFVPVIDGKDGAAYAKISLFDYTSEKFYESMIKRELKDELGADFKVTLDMYSAGEMKKGVFRGLKLYTDRIFYKGLSLSDVYAETAKENNKIIYKNKRVWYPENLPLKFNAVINNNDLSTALTSDLFVAKMDKLNDKLGGFINVDTPRVSIKTGKLYFDIPFNSFFSSKTMYIHFISDIGVENNELMLKNITFTSNSNFIDANLLNSLVSQLNPVKIGRDALQNKFCNILIESAEIKDDIINLDGNLIIKANYRGNNE